MRINDNDDFYSRGNSNIGKIIISGILMLTLIAVVIGAVLYANKDILNRSQKKKTPEKSEKVHEEPEFELSDSSKLTAEDLDFWNMYDENEAPDIKKKKAASKSQAEMEKTEKDSSSASDGATDSAAEKSSDTDEETEEKEASGVNPAGNNEDADTFNAADSGEEELLPIYENIPRNAYIADGFRQEGNELQYFSSNRKTSSYGIDISKYQGDIDWEKTAESGIDFAMIRMGVRGYSSGQVVADEQFIKNIEGATEHGIDAGIYFYSQATTVQEAVEEANYAVAAAKPYNVTYPIVFYTEKIANDTARTDNLTADELSAIAKAFCDTVKGYGYKPMICASKHRLAADMDVSALTGYDIWLVDAPLLKEGDKLSMSEYPYQYTMWQYSSTGRIDGIDADVDLDISFVDYKYR